MTTNEITKKDDAALMESVLLQGDLSKLTPPQRVSYYQKVCESIGLNPLTRPFDYINLNGKLTLYAKKDATDQLRSLHSVSIDDVDITETPSQFIVKVKGHDETGRTDVEIGVVNKSDMQGNLANAQMKAVTKGKRRLTLSLCGLGWLDETEVEAIPAAEPVAVLESGEIAAPPEPAKEAQILHDLGYGDSVKASYSPDQYEALIRAGLAKNVYGAQGMLALSNLPSEASPALVEAWGQEYRIIRPFPITKDAPDARSAAEKANEWYTAYTNDIKEGSGLE